MIALVGPAGKWNVRSSATCVGSSRLLTGAVDAGLTELVTQVLARAPEWVRSELAAKDPVTRRRAEETMAAMITAALRERDQPSS